MDNSSTIVERQTKIIVSQQANVLLLRCNLSKQEFIDWYISQHGIELSGMQVIEYISYIEEHKSIQGDTK